MDGTWTSPNSRKDTWYYNGPVNYEADAHTAMGKIETPLRMCLSADDTRGVFQAELWIYDSGLKQAVECHSWMPNAPPPMPDDVSKCMCSS